MRLSTQNAGNAMGTVTRLFRIRGCAKGKKSLTRVMRGARAWGETDRFGADVRPSRFFEKWSAGLAVALVAALLLTASPAQAQGGAYPTMPVKVMVGFAPGGGVDVLARLLGQKMSGLWGQPVLVENRPGASTSIATRAVADASPDGYTVLLNSNSMVVNQVVNPDAGYDIERQLIPVINVAWQPTVIVAANNLPVSSLADVIALSKKRKLSFGSPGTGTPQHLVGVQLFKILSKTDIVQVPYNGAAPALSAVAGNQIELAIVTLPPAVPLIKSGRLKAIAVTTAKPAASLPTLPTVAESGFPGFDVSNFNGYFMPVKTPKAITDAFRQTVIKVLAMPDIKEKLAGFGYEFAVPEKENFPRLVSDEIKMWQKVVKEGNIKIE